MKQLKTISAIILAAMLATASMLSIADAAKKDSPGAYFDDSVVTTKVKAAIFNDSTLKATEINVETHKGVVQLTGFVKSEADIKKAVEVARSVKGVASVKNDMVVKGKQ